VLLIRTHIAGCVVCGFANEVSVEKVRTCVANNIAAMAHLCSAIPSQSSNIRVLKWQQPCRECLPMALQRQWCADNGNAAYDPGMIICALSFPTAQFFCPM
jgi:hypothetical protein